MATLAVSNFAPDARLTSGASSRGVPSRHLSSRALHRTSGGAGRLASPASAPKVKGRSTALSVKALVNIDLGPSAILGASVMASAIGLYQVRASRPEVSRDQDVFFSSIGLLTGGILVFQGWRLDPLMLFGQLLTAGTAISFASEAVGLRQEILDREATEVMSGNDTRDGRGRRYARRNDGRDGGSSRGGGPGGPLRPLPPPRARRVNYRDQDVGTRQGGWNDAPNNWDARDTRNSSSSGEPWRQQSSDEYVYDASMSTSSSDARRPQSGDGGFMDAFDEARGDTAARKTERPDLRSKNKSDDFGPARFGSEADDWEL